MKTDAETLVERSVAAYRKQINDRVFPPLCCCISITTGTIVSPLCHARACDVVFEVSRHVKRLRHDVDAAVQREVDSREKAASLQVQCGYPWRAHNFIHTMFLDMLMKDF